MNSSEISTTHRAEKHLSVCQMASMNTTERRNSGVFKAGAHKRLYHVRNYVIKLISPPFYN